MDARLPCERFRTSTMLPPAAGWLLPGRGRASWWAGRGCAVAGPAAAAQAQENASARACIHARTHTWGAQTRHSCVRACVLAPRAERACALPDQIAHMYVVHQPAARWPPGAASTTTRRWARLLHPAHRRPSRHWAACARACVFVCARACSVWRGGGDVCVCVYVPR